MLDDERQDVKSCCSASRESVEQLDESVSAQKSKSVTKQSITDRSEDMILIKGGSFLMGTYDQEGFPADGEGPVREVFVDDFYMTQHTVTNKEILQFVEETNYVTDAEKFGWSFVFEHFISEQTALQVTQRVQHTPWWWVVHGADFKHPEGPDSTIDDRLDHPAIHISWNDALAYCQWAGTRLPTEAEWEYAARGGLKQKRYPWGDELTPNGEHYCNIWQGSFPDKNTGEDGYIGTAPAKSFPPNGYGLYNMSGNVWEWCSDWFSKFHRRERPNNNPTGPKQGTTKVMRGGSYL